MKWTDEKKEMLIELSAYHSDEEVARILSETFDVRLNKYAVRRRRQRLNIVKMSGRGRIGIKNNIQEGESDA